MYDACLCVCARVCVCIYIYTHTPIFLCICISMPIQILVLGPTKCKALVQHSHATIKMVSFAILHHVPAGLAQQFL